MFNNMKISTRVFMLVCFMSVALIVLGINGLMASKDSIEGLEKSYSDVTVPMKELKVIADMYAVNIVDTSHKVRNGNLSFADGRKNVEEAQKNIAEKWKAFSSTWASRKFWRWVDRTR